jgi:hypothetical protein
MRPPTSQDFQRELNYILASSRQQGKFYIDVRAGDLHRRVGGYPGKNARMPVCCEVMRRNMRLGDEILQQPPKGNGANLVIRYYLHLPPKEIEKNQR